MMRRKGRRLTPAEIERRAREDAWMYRLQPGDVVRMGSGDMRVVREVSVRRFGTYYGRRKPSGMVTFAIRQCSWTGRCETVLTFSDIRRMGARPARARVRLNKRIDREFQRSLASDAHDRLRCCDVKGMP